MQMIQDYAKNAKQANNMHVSKALKRISNQFRNGQMIQILFLIVQKAKVIVTSTLQISKHHQLKEEKINVKRSGITLERVPA